MIISIIERLARRERKYIPFQDWVFGQDEKYNVIYQIMKKRCKSIQENNRISEKDYYAVFGLQQNVVDFFKKYVTIEDKIKIIKSFRVKKTKVVKQYSIYVIRDHPMSSVNNIEELKEKYGFPVYEAFMPLCYNWKYCWIEYYSECCPQISCNFKEDKQLQEEVLNKVVKLIYRMRSNFIHNAEIPPISEKGLVSTPGIINNKLFFVELTSEELQEIFERAFKKYFDKLTEMESDNKKTLL